MVKCYRRLNESLQESFLQAVRFPPGVFPHFVRVIELAGIEVANSPMIKAGVQGCVSGSILPTKAREDTLSDSLILEFCF